MDRIVYVFGNGNVNFENYLKYYYNTIINLLQIDNSLHFIICDFKGVDTLTMELLKCMTPNVSILHIGNHPRYLPDKYKTQASKWKIKGGFQSDFERDNAAINLCTHFLAFDFNSSDKKKAELKQILKVV